MRLFLLPYKAGSVSAKSLAEKMGIKRSSLNRTTPNPRKRTIINWGHSGNELSEYVLSNTEKVYNPPANVATAINKLSCLQTLLEAGVRVPPFTTVKEEACQWIANGKEVVERHLLRGSGGDGIKIKNRVGDVENAPLYTQYTKKKFEYRIHIIGGHVADIQRKARSTSATVVDWKIRNLASGFIFMRKGVTAPQDVVDQALLAMQALDLDFGAVDVIYNAHEEQAYVLEVNTACGLEGTTLDLYADGLEAMVKDKPLKDWTHWQEAVEEAQETEAPLEWSTNTDRQYEVTPAPAPRSPFDGVRTTRPYRVSFNEQGNQQVYREAPAVEASDPYDPSVSLSDRISQARRRDGESLDSFAARLRSLYGS